MTWTAGKKRRFPSKETGAKRETGNARLHELLMLA